MKGKVRSREKQCPAGHGVLTVKEEIDIKCPVCNYRPRTYYIDLYWAGDQVRISRGKDGDILYSYRQAHRLLEIIRAEIDARTFEPSRYVYQQVEQYRGHSLLPKWLSTKTDKAPTTRREYNRYVTQYFMPYFGQSDLRDLRTSHVEDFMGQLPEHLSVKTKKNIQVALRNICGWLRDRETLVKMPAFKKIVPPDYPIECISRADQLKVLAALKQRHRDFFSFLVYHPVRPGEARALKRKHFDVKTMVVHICDAWSLKEIRHRKSKKDYYLPISAAWDVSTLSNKLPEAWVFLNEAGRPYKPENIRRIWKRACKRAGVPEIKLYNGTRHSTLTNALQTSGGDMWRVSKLAGHSSQKMTEERYARMNVEILRGMTDGGTTTQLQHKEAGCSG